MKRIVFVFLLLPLSVFAQFYLGVNAGVNASTVRFDDENFNKAFRQYLQPYWGYRFGISSEFYFAEALSLKTSAIYTRKGFKYQQTYTSGWKQFNYFQVSAAGKIDFNPFEETVFSFFVSPYIAYWISGRELEAYAKYNTLLTQDIYLGKDSSFRYNRYDAGVNLGFQITKQLSRKKRFFLELGYDFGMVSNAIENVFGTKNRSLYLAAGVLWKL